MSSIEVYASDNYFTSTPSQASRDKCLCGSYVRNTDTECRAALNDKCFNDIVVGTDQTFKPILEKFVTDCEKDAGVMFFFLFLFRHFLKLN
jgi:hypothetical protein